MAIKAIGEKQSREEQSKEEKKEPVTVPAVSRGIREVKDFGSLPEYDKVNAMKRIQKERWVARRYPSGIKSVDDIFGGGLPFGLSIFVGEAGTGKSLLMKNIARKTGKKAMYIGCESKVDNPNTDVVFADYTSYLPNWKKAVDECFGLARDLNVDLLCIDSLTTFCSGTNKAVMEADIRPAVFRIANMCEGKIPVIGISEVRGSGNLIYPAGGQAIAHACSLYVWFYRQKMNRWSYEKYHAGGEGEVVWSADIIKDKEGRAMQGNEFRILYDKSMTEPKFNRISYKSIGKEKEEVDLKELKL